MEKYPGAIPSGNLFGEAKYLIGELSAINALDDFDAWWQRRMLPLLPHDCAVLGTATVMERKISISEIIFQRGLMHEDPQQLLPHGDSLLAAWHVMQQACLLDLGPCSCIGQRAEDRNDPRGFLIHGFVPSPGTILFTIVSARHWWPSVRAAKHLLTALMEPLANTVARIPAAPKGLGDARASKAKLTAREVEIINWLGQGRTNKEIARKLGTSPNTVRNQISLLAQKVGARNRAQLAIMTTASIGNSQRKRIPADRVSASSSLSMTEPDDDPRARLNIR